MLQDFCKYNDLGHRFAARRNPHRFYVYSITNRNVYINVGTDRRGTDITTKDGIPLTGNERLPSGRGIAGWFRKIFYR